VLITGASSGFGETTARRFAAAGWNVTATMRDPARSPDFSGLDSIVVLALDVTDAASIEAAVAATVARFGAIDVVVNNAGYGLFGVFEATPDDAIRAQFEVNLFGVMAVTRAVLPHFRARRAGVFVNISSGAGVFTLPAISLYAASKFALEGFSEALDYEVAGLGIAVKIVESGGVTSTKFGERSAAEAGGLGDLPADYAPFAAHIAEVFAKLRASRGRATQEEVAEVILTAATDGTRQMRYIATDDIKPLVAKRRETSEAEYRAHMLATFG
jgi:NAD(P)-dependent dehydrogenase (short-subunit alcohol dehydrogenase family)